MLGGLVAGPVARRWGIGRTIIVSNVVRIPLYCAYPMAPPGDPGLVVLIIGFTGILLLSSISNAAITATRMEHTPDHLMSRSSAAWGLGTMAAGTLLIPLLGALAEVAGVRVSLWVVVALVALSVAALPVRDLTRDDPRTGSVPQAE